MEGLKTLKKKAADFYNKKQFEKALEYYLKILEKEANNADVYYDLGDTYDELKQYDKAINAYKKSIELNPDSAESYNGLGIVYYNTREYNKSIRAYKKSIEISPMYASPYNGLGNTYERLKQYNRAIRTFKKCIDIDPKFSYPHNGLGNVYYCLKEYDKAIEAYNKCLELEPDDADSYNGLGNVYSELGEYTKAIEAYNNSIKLSPKYEYPYNGLGNVYTSLKEYENAIKAFNKSIEFNPNYAQAYNGLGIVYKRTGEYEKAIQAYKKSIELDPYFYYPIYNIAILLYTDTKYEESKKYYQEYIHLVNNVDEYYSKIAASRIEEIDRLLANKELQEVNENIKSKVNNILDLLLYSGKCVIHYTSLTVTQSLIFDKSKFRLSEGAFLNDTAEGTELFKFLDFNIKPENNDILKGLPFTQKPHIGSFVAENKYNDLTLWRMYGKENKEEAKGCALVIDRQNFVASIKNEKTKGSSVSGIDKEFRFFRVAYNEHQKDSKCKFIIPGDGKSEKKLNKYMIELKTLIDKFNSASTKTHSDTQLIVEILNDIAYLFKSAEYQHEHELRLVVDGAGFDKIIDYNKEYKTAPPRVYIELVDVTSLIERLTIGPKVEKGEEWAAAFHYQFDKAGSSPQILISHLPYK